MPLALPGVKSRNQPTPRSAMKTSQALFAEPEREIEPSTLRVVPARVAPVLKPEIYAPGWARCPRCQISYLYDTILYPWCPGCCDRPGEA